MGIALICMLTAICIALIIAKWKVVGRRKIALKHGGEQCRS